MSHDCNHFYEFGPFRLCPAEKLLTCDGEPVALAPKVFETLVVLVQHSGHLVTKDELLTATQQWSDILVVLKVQGSALDVETCADRPPGTACCRCLRRLLMKHIRLSGKERAHTSKPAAARA